MSQPEGAAVRIAFVDVDGTLLDCSSERLFLGELVRTGSFGFRSALSFCLGYVAHPVRTWRIGPGWNRRYLTGRHGGSLRAAAERFCASRLEGRIRPEVRRILAGLSAEGFRIVLLSASLSMLVDPLKRAVGALDSICSDPEEENGILTGRLSGERPWGSAKMELAAGYAAGAGASPADCCALGNSSSDIPLLTACGTAYAVHPSGRLRRTAGSRGWKIVEGR